MLPSRFSRQLPKQLGRVGGMEYGRAGRGALLHKIIFPYLIIPRYPVVEFQVDNLFMVGSPMGIFLTICNTGNMPIKIPKCSNIFNIYNPNDPVVCGDLYACTRSALIERALCFEPLFIVYAIYCAKAGWVSWVSFHLLVWVGNLLCFALGVFIWAGVTFAHLPRSGQVQPCLLWDRSYLKSFLDLSNWATDRWGICQPVPSGLSPLRDPVSFDERCCRQIKVDYLFL